MNESPTRSAILDAARELFSRHGYRGASVRAITGLAGANLGAVAYHFGSKQGLFDAVTSTVARAARERIVAAARTSGTPLRRIEAVVRAFFEHLYENADVPQLVIHTMVSGGPVPDAAHSIMGDNLQTLAQLIAEGQADGSIRDGNPQLMALSVASQPLWLVVARRLLREGMAVNQEDAAARAELVESVVAFVRAGLSSNRETDGADRHGSAHPGSGEGK